jgi:PAS domain S-box-containing protein
MESADLFFIFIGAADLILAAVFIYYAFKNSLRLKGAVSQYLMTIGAFFFVITGVVSATGILIFHTVFIARYIVFIIGFILISIGEIYSGIVIRKIIGKKSWLTITHIFSYSGYRSGGTLVILLFTIPLWTLDIIYGPSSIYGIVSSFFTFLGFTFLIIGERKLYIMTNVFSEMAITDEREKIGLLRDDIAAVKVYADIINTFISFGKPATTEIIVNDTLKKWSEEHPVLFDNSVLRNGKIDPSIVTNNLDRLYEKNRLSTVLKDFSLLMIRLVDLYGSFTSSEYAKERLSQSYQIIRNQYNNISIIFDILKTMPIGTLEEEKLAVLSRDELEEKVKERTIKLVNANEELKIEIKERKSAEELLRSERDKAQQYLDIAGVIFVAINTEGIVTLINKKGCEILGYEEHEIVGKNWFDNFVPKHIKDVLLPISKQLFSGEIKPVEYFENQILTKNREERLIAWHNTVIRDVHGTIIGHLSSGEDITERRKAEEAIVQSEKKYRELADSLPQIVYETDEHANLTFVNQASFALTGYTQEDFNKGLNSLQMVAACDRERLKSTILKIMQGEKISGNEYFIQRKDGTTFPVILHSTPIIKEDKVIGFRGFAIDITDRKKAEEKLKSYQQEIEQQNIQLKKLDKIKSDFLNVTSHELRTPMSAIKGYVQMILKQKLGQITDEQRQALDVVLRNTDRLDNLIRDILDVSRLESGTMKFVAEKTDTRKIVHEAIETMQPTAELKNIKINTEVEQDVSELTIDRERIKQVIINIVNNAIKFSPNGSIINVRTKKDNDQILFEIQDFGRGIPKDKQEKIFDIFYQVDSGIDRKFGGAGLGLSIARGIVLSHGGNIWVESTGTHDEGSIFRFTLPLTPVQDLEGKFRDVDIFKLKGTKYTKKTI